MEAEATFGEIGSYYDRLVRQHGHHYRACDYGRAESQARKFEVLSGGHPVAGKSVLDVGCGFCDYADYLKSRFEGVRYTGVDISAEMIRRARELHPELDIRLFNILSEDPGRFDVVTANGIFYLLGEDAWHLMKRLIARMFQLTDEGVAFNSLSSLATEQDFGEFYAEPSQVLAYCQTLTPRIVLRHDYMPHDFTVFLHKQPA